MIQSMGCQVGQTSQVLGKTTVYTHQVTKCDVGMFKAGQSNQLFAFDCFHGLKARSHGAFFCLRLRYIYMRFYEIVHTVRWVWMLFTMYTYCNRTEWVWNPFMCDITHKCIICRANRTK